MNKSFFLYIYREMNIPDKDVFEINAYYTWMGEDGIARTVAKPNINITLADALENSEVVTNFPGENKFPIIVDARNVKSMTKEARDHFSIKNRKSRTSAFAIIVDSPVSRIIANFFIRLNNPTVPVRLVKSESEAIKWCSKFMNENG